ncbi:MAG: hypothetical protein OH319_03695 [Candidatus Parvarchaeota archaeon]|nr:hypothetical protein [Candidatus Jingweiarchaeum tengchongense]MCW1298584.1 hypothetical protein [Candidatus Jingweiarchaeum tengchongense]MCW1300430.1 hypothetical protein [Candidatus Jingweiarchaeum tengchongense]MCW1304608.1 hypothetical protein [Candidatus Jingweiarchaeum tengchongense]MCW1306082.1 hypothetical protein [Candidatus Jingweiarchaeum tengchongense]
MIPFVKREGKSYKIGIRCKDKIELSIIIEDPNGNVEIFLPDIKDLQANSFYDLTYLCNVNLKKVRKSGDDYFVFFEPEKKGKFIAKFLINKGNEKLMLKQDFYIN